MLDKLVPDKYYKNIYSINYKSLKKIGIKCLIFDLGNTLEPETVKVPSKKVKDLFEDLKALDFKIVIMSNSLKKTIEPFKEQLCVDSCYLSFKPFKRKYKKILRVLGLKNNDVACIGDQLFFDILGANNMDFLSILVNPTSLNEYTVNKLNRKIENIFVRKLENKDLFKRGRYYE